MKHIKLFLRKILISIPLFNRKAICYKLLGANYIMREAVRKVSD